MRSKQWTIPLLAVSALCVAACGGGDEGSDTSDDATTEIVANSEPEATDATVAETTQDSVAPTTKATTTTTSTSTTTVPPATTTTLPSNMPELIGQEIADVRAQMSVYNVQITEVQLIDASPAGTVIDQDPLPGERFSTSLTLTVSVAPPPVPTLIGLDVAEARDDLTDAGFTVREQEQLDEIAPDGEVVAQDPAPGAENEGEVLLTVARRPVVFGLFDVEYVDGTRRDTGTYSSNAVTYPDSLAIGDGGFEERNLSRSFRQLVAKYGVQDDDTVDVRYEIRVFGDGRLLFEGATGFGETLDLDVNVTDVLRLRIEASRIAGSGTLVVGTPRLLGLEGEVPEL